MSKKHIPGPFLSQIKNPEDLRKKFKEDDLIQVSDELRQYIIVN